MRKLVIWLTAAAVAIAGIVLAASATAKGEKATVGPSVVGIHAPCPTTHPPWRIKKNQPTRPRRARRVGGWGC